MDMFPSQHFYERPYAQNHASDDPDLERCIFMLRAAHSCCERDPYMRIPALIGHRLRRQVCRSWGPEAGGLNGCSNPGFRIQHMESYGDHVLK